MESIVTYKKPGIETTRETPSGPSRRQVIFVVALPLLFLVAGLLANLIRILLGPTVTGNPILSTIFGFVLGILFFIVFIPKVLKMPLGRTTLRNYLNHIGVDRIRPVSRTFLIYVPCLISIIVAQIVGSLVYNHMVLHWNYDLFVNHLFDFQRITTWIGWGPITALGSIFEEVVLRGVVLTMLLQVYSERKAIAGSAVAFGYVHILNLLNGPITYASLVFVAGQITWTTIIGVLYGYMFIKTGNLYANMFLHWTANGLSNCFMYLPYVTPEIHALLNIVFNIGLMSTLISLLWVALVNKYWPRSNRENQMERTLEKLKPRSHTKKPLVSGWTKFGLTT
ncbi:MAG: type II CAAX endopeptidase family protein [Candidatus Thorarchaeota archaeon]|jgi:membrane protease YdiL (CAAX protease family)